MKYTSKIKLMLPEVGTQSNWGSAINYNFNLLDTEIVKLYSELNSTKNILGVGVPYYKELYDTQGNGPYKFVEIIQGDKYYTFKYYTSITSSGTGSGDPLQYTSSPDNQGVQLISSGLLGIGAYVINTDEISVNLGGSTAKYKRGDLIVAISSVGSIYDDDYVQIKFQKYPDTGFYIEPQVSIKDAETIINYSQKNYVDWTIRNTTVSYASTPAFYFFSGNMAASFSHTMTVADTSTTYGAIVQFFTQDNNPLYVQYKQNVSVSSANKTVTVTIEPECVVSNAKYCLYIGKSISASASIQQQS